MLVGAIAGSATLLAVSQKSLTLVRKRGAQLRGGGRSSDRDTTTRRSDEDLDPDRLAKDAAATDAELLRALLLQMKLQQDEMSVMRRELSCLRARSDESPAADPVAVPGGAPGVVPASVVTVSNI